jgi:hypothetical protein
VDPDLGGRRPRPGPGDSAAKQAIAKTNRWVIALRPTTDTAAGKAQLVTDLQSQLATVRKLVESARTGDAAMGHAIKLAALGYEAPTGAVRPHPPAPPAPTAGRCPRRCIPWF